MKSNVYSKDINMSSELVKKIEDELSFLDRYLVIDEDTTAVVLAKKYGEEVKVEITIPSKIGYLRSEVVDKQLTVAVDEALEKLEGQLRKQKTRLSRRHKEKLALSFIEDEFDEVDAKVAKTKRIIAEEMDEDQAIVAMETSDHNFFAYRDTASKSICILYRRNDGDYGIIELV